MAGIGFILKKLLEKNDLSGMAAAWLHGAIAAAGPWLMTCISLGLLFLITRGAQNEEQVVEYFRGPVLYNFCFSLVLASPITVVTTRFLSDLIYKKNLYRGLGMLFSALVLLWTLGSTLAIPFYFFYATLPFNVALMAVINFILISGIWQTQVFISALKQYNGVTLSFVGGLTVSIIAGWIGNEMDRNFGMLAGFNLGLSAILGSLLGLIFVDWPLKIKRPWAVFVYFRRYWELGFGGLFYGMAIWVDKWVMWTSPKATTYSSGLVMYPVYDGALFVASLSMVPALALFLVTQETGFYERYLRFYSDIQRHVSLDKIQENHKEMLTFVAMSARNLLLLQFGITGLLVIAVPKLIPLLGMSFLQLGIFRYALLGVGFHVLALFCQIVLAYFDARREVMLLQGAFFLLNGALTTFSLWMGFGFYGWGYFASSAFVFFLSAGVLWNYIEDLPYRVFVTSNTSVIGQG